MSIQSHAVLTSALFALASRCCLAAPTPLVIDSPVKKVFLTEYLTAMGEKLGCHFTVEAKGPAENLLYTQVPGDQNVKTIDDLKRKLRQELPNIAVGQDKRNPKILNIMDNQLSQGTDYVLNKQLDFTYSGALGGLPYTLGKQLDAVITTPNKFNVSHIHLDLVTSVQFDAKKQTVRAILTDYVPLAHYSTILWEADTDEFNGKPRTLVRYYGPASVKPKPADAAPPAP